jgi:AcrR family transcriptional regulator
MPRRALKLFTERGYDGVSIQMIASGTGLSKAAVSYHFGTKEDLLNAVVGPASSDLDASFEQVSTAPLKPPRRHETLAEYATLLVTHRALLAFLAKEGDGHDPEASDDLREHLLSAAERRPPRPRRQPT